MAKKLKKEKSKKVQKEVKEEVVEKVEIDNEESEEKEKTNKKPVKKLKINKKKCIVLGCILFVIIGLIVGIIIYKKGVHEYPIIYKGKNNNLYLLKDGAKPSEAVSFSNRDGIGYISFFNDNPRYFLYKKSVDLYIYDVKKLSDKKIISNYSASFVTNDDNYVVAIDTLGTIYSYKLNKEVKEIGENVVGDVAFTNDNILYEDDNGDFYLGYLNGKKSSTKITSNVKAYQFTDDGSKVVYLNEDNDLIIYNIRNGKENKVNSDVEDFYCDSDECDDMYYVMKNDDVTSILYYNGSKSSVYVKDAYDLEAVDVDANILLYSIKDDKKYSLYMKDGKADPVLVEEEYGINGYAKIFDAKDIYYVTNVKELKNYNIKKGKTVSLLKDVDSGFIDCKEGYYIATEINAVGGGTLYYIEGTEATKVNDNVYTFNYYFVNKKGDKLYYYTDMGDKSASLYVFDGKENTLISEKVYQYQYINDDLIYYLRDYDTINMHGTLYRYYKEKKEVITDRVQSLVQFNIREYRK